MFRGSSDYFGLNHYTADLVEPLPTTKKIPDSKNDDGLLYTFDKEWLSSQSSWLKVSMISTISDLKVIIQ